MLMNLLVFALLVAVTIVIVLLAALLRRHPERVLEAHRAALEQALRDEQRDGRGE
jgi:DNA recombination protein RmuC